jgi:hypothetical protein
VSALGEINSKNRGIITGRMKVYNINTFLDDGTGILKRSRVGERFWPDFSFFLLHQFIRSPPKTRK